MNIEFNLPPALVLGLVVSTILPILVGLVTTRVTKSSLKAVLLAGLSAVTGLLTELLAAVNAGVAYDLGNGLVFALTAFLVAVAMHYGLWKPTTVSAKAQEVLVKPSA
ncbi:holin [Microbacterium phage Jemerald]|nr:membrane protein [Microbacterium phage Juicer]WNO27266.1 holin [Microbacterium phage Jemerald]